MSSSNHSTLRACTPGFCFTDFSEGLDLVDHRALLHELEVLGVHEAIFRWAGAFLVDRQQRVRINGQLSLPISTRDGIPQGTRLVPMVYHHGSNISSGSQSYDTAPTGKCKRFNDFLTAKFKNVFRDSVVTAIGSNKRLID